MSGSSSRCTGNRIDPAHRAVGIPYMVGKPVVVMVPVEIVQYEVAAEAEPIPPEWPWDPGIEIIVFPWRRIIAHDGRPVLVIVLLNIGGRLIFGNLRRRSGLV